MYDFSIWSVNLGRWSGVRVRLHVFFLLFVVGTIYLTTRAGSGDLVWIGALAMLILFVSVLLHELGHCYTALRLGGHADQIVIGPLGGLAPVSVPHEPQHELAAAMSGPIVNFMICLIVAPILIMMSDDSLLGLLPLLAPENLVEGTVLEVTLKLTFWLNWVLLLVNLLPAFPFDGGRALRSILWPRVGYRGAVVWVGRAAKLVALALCVAALWIYTRDRGAAEIEAAGVSSWVPLVLMAIFLFFSANHEVARRDRTEPEEEFLGYDFSQGYTSMQRSEEPSQDDEVGLIEGWRERRRESKEKARRETERIEERRVDEILDRLHKSGMEGLSDEDREILHRVSARFRDRLNS